MVVHWELLPSFLSAGCTKDLVKRGHVVVGTNVSLFAQNFWVADTKKFSTKISETFLCLQQMLHAQANRETYSVSTTMCHILSQPKQFASKYT